MISISAGCVFAVETCLMTRLCSTSALFASAFMSDTDSFSRERRVLSGGGGEAGYPGRTSAAPPADARRLLIGGPPDHRSKKALYETRAVSPVRATPTFQAPPVQSGHREALTLGQKRQNGTARWQQQGRHLIRRSVHAEQLFWDYPDSNVRLTLMLFSSPPIV